MISQRNIGMSKFLTSFGQVIRTIISAQLKPTHAFCLDSIFPLQLVATTKRTQNLLLLATWHKKYGCIEHMNFTIDRYFTTSPICSLKSFNNCRQPQASLPNK